jgi:formylglycine-generating enzyme required for sulfatase activity
MSAGVDTYRDDLEATYAVDFSRDREPKPARKRFPEYRRKGGAPTRVSGMHCRRSKRWTWGSGRGARMLNAKAFAGAVAFLVASLAGSVFAAPISISMQTVGNPGNTGNAGSTPSGLGAVADVFQIGTTEVTNAQYVAFLTAVGASNTNGVFNDNMESNSLGGIQQDGSSGSFTYSVKAGAGNNPVNFVNWFSAARFANWLAGGQQTGSAGIASMEVGSYTLGNATTGSIVPRNPGATFVLPSLNEWYKAGFFNGTTYTTYQTNSNDVPTATLTFTTPNAANLLNVAGGPVAVGSYVNTTSAYGLFDMLGNVTEMTDTDNGAGSYRAMGGGFGGGSGGWNATTANVVTYTGDAAFNSVGFRVAAVPEPSTLALAGVAISGLAGYEWSRRRKVKAAALAG